MLSCYFGHHKCGSTWIEAICGDVCFEAGRRMDIVFRTEDLAGESLGGFVGRTRTELLAFANADYRQVLTLPQFKGFHVVRDPRDVVVSAYFSHLHSHPTQHWPELVAYRERLRACSRGEGLSMEIDFRAEQFQEMMSWPDEVPNVLQLRFEELIAAPFSSFITIFQHLELLDDRHFDVRARAVNLLRRVVARVAGRAPGQHPVPTERLLGIVWEHDFAKKSGGRQAGQEDVHSHFRKGQAGDWVNYFQPEHRRRFHERHGPLLRKYGYESDARWVDSVAPAARG
jgi:hypothetical protein